VAREAHAQWETYVQACDCCDSKTPPGASISEDDKFPSVVVDQIGGSNDHDGDEGDGNETTMPMTMAMKHKLGAFQVTR